MSKKNKISVVVCTYNNEEMVARCLESVKWADEIIVVDDGSTDNTVGTASKFTNNIFKHKSQGYVEPVRNFAISKATHEWILILDSDERVSQNLSEKLKEYIQNAEISYIEIPRKNIIFGKWMQASMWWPDYNVRFFKKGTVVWSDRIHSNPTTKGKGLKLNPTEENAITHHNYSSVGQFVERNSKYSKIQARELFDEGVRFNWTDIIKKPLGEFLGRYFANKGYEDGMHGLVLSFLQAFMFLLQYLYLWELSGYDDQKVTLNDVKKISKSAGGEIKYWIDFSSLSNNLIKRKMQKLRNKLT